MTTKYLAVGGHLNIFSGTVTVDTALLDGTPTAGAWGSPLSTDATRLIDIGGGELVVAGNTTAQVADMTTRGILEGNGVVATSMLTCPAIPFYRHYGRSEPSFATLLARQSSLSCVAGWFPERLRRSLFQRGRLVSASFPYDGDV